jgi:ribonuclease P protein component
MTGIKGITLSVLKKRAEFLAIAQKGKKWVTQSFVLQLSPSPPAEKISVIRYGLTASGKIGNAVTRNRAKRRMRALIHEILPLYAMPGHDYILVARAATAVRDYADLKKDFLWALKKTGTYRENSG